MEYTMYDTLRHLPLFQGMSQTELSVILDKVKLNFLKFADKEIIFRQGEPCDKLVLLIAGQLTSETVAPCGTFSLEETFERPAIVELHSLFGKCPSYKATYRACGETALLTIEKQYIYSVLTNYDIFRMNFFNQLSNTANRQHEQRWSIMPQSLDGRLRHLISTLCSTPHGRKILRITMDDLAQLLDDTRLNISNTLNQWQNEGLIEMRRKEYVILDLERLNAI